MEGKANMKKYNHRQVSGSSGVSPERAKVWTEKSPKYHYNHHHHLLQSQNQQQQQQQSSSKVPVVYYLCRNRQLEHPHFIEVAFSSPDGFYLRDVIERLNVLRGRGMASMYSWSCKRSYKNGFVWHDLCEDDLILPAHGNEYVLKGSELFEESNSGHFSPAYLKLPNPKSLPEPPSSRCQDDSSSSSSMNERATKHSQDDELSPPFQRLGSAAVSPESCVGKNSSWNGPLSLTEYKVYKNDGLADASTQTDENENRVNRVGETCTRGVSTDDGTSEHEHSATRQNQISQVKETSEISRDSVSPPPSSSSASSSGARIDTLDSLIRADASKLNSFRILEEEELRTASSSKKASNMLMQLISCGSISVKDYSFGLVPTYKPRFTSSKFPSPFFSSSFMLGELDCLTENPRLMGLRLEDKEYFSGSLVETNMLKEVGIPTLKRSSSYNADRTSKQFDLDEENDDSSTTHSKCIPRSIKTSLSKQPRSESMRSPLCDGPRISSDGVESSRIASSISNGARKTYTEPSSAKQQSRRLESSKAEKENVIKIEESLLQELGL